MKNYYLENEGGKVFYREYEDGKVTKEAECDLRPESMSKDKMGAPYITLPLGFDNPRKVVKYSFVANPGDSYEVKAPNKGGNSSAPTKVVARDAWADTLVKYLEFKAQGAEKFAESLKENPLWFNYLTAEDMEEFKTQFIERAMKNAIKLYPVELDNLKEQLLNELPEDKKATFEVILK